jgi:hypothetical protein
MFKNFFFRCRSNKVAKFHYSTQAAHVLETSSLAKQYTAPHLWYPRARQMTRRIIAHVGPTNSGKTHTAVQRILEDSSVQGLYCSPLRLLAWETFERLNESGAKTNLLTGQEKDIRHEDARVLSCTVEMAMLQQKFDVAVIDEIQMLADKHRGHAWTRALLGVQADEVHVCGEVRAIPLLQKICEAMGEELIINTYDRLSPLDHNTEDYVSSYRHLKPGDCVVAFKRRDLYTIKRKIERTTGRKCCIIYGALPPAIRKSQAVLFNTPDNGHDILVATDAVGMGLNLAIKRVIFESMTKFNGVKQVELTPAEVRQIGGRAGRYKSQFPKGYVTCRNKRDLQLMHTKMSEDIPPLTSACLAPTLEQISMFANSTALVTFQAAESAMLNFKTRKQRNTAWNKFVTKHSARTQIDMEGVRAHQTSTGEVGRGRRVCIDGHERDVERALKDLGELMCPKNVHEETSAHVTDGSGESGEQVEFFLSLPKSRASNITAEFLDMTREKYDCLFVCDDADDTENPLLFCRGSRGTCAKILENIGTQILRSNGPSSNIDLSETSLSYLLSQFEEAARVESQVYNMGDLSEMKEIAEFLQHLRMPLELRFMLCHTPVFTRSRACVSHFLESVRKLITHGVVELNLKLPRSEPKSPLELMRLEDLYKMIDVYLWLAMKFEDEFVDRNIALEMGAKAIDMIQRYLEKEAASSESIRRNQRRQNRRRR